MSRENDLKGIFIKLMLEKQTNNISEENREKIENRLKLIQAMHMCVAKNIMEETKNE